MCAAKETRITPAQHLDLCQKLWLSLAELYIEMQSPPDEQWVNRCIRYEGENLMCWRFEDINTEFFRKCVPPRVKASGLDSDCFVCEGEYDAAEIHIRMYPYDPFFSYSGEVHHMRYWVLTEFCDNYVPF